METTVDDLAIEIVQGDIAAQPGFDAIVNAANAELMPGGGVAGAIHRAAGPGLAAECRSLGPIEPGQSVITGGHGLPNRWVIHCLGPVYGRDEPAAELLGSCYRGALELAEATRITALAFPSISTGVFGYPIREAAEIAVGAVVAQARSLGCVRRVRFVLFDQEAHDVHAAALAGAVAVHRQRSG